MKLSQIALVLVAVATCCVGVRAYQLWERAGKPAGKDLDFWLKAEEQLSSARHPDLVVVPVLRK